MTTRTSHPAARAAATHVETGYTDSARLFPTVAYTRAAYYLLTGAWPPISLRTCEWITGPKVDGWLVRTFGVLVAIIGGVLALAGYRRGDTPEVRLLGAGTVLGLAASEPVFGARGRISPVYLLDVAGDAGFLAGWIALRLGARQGRRESPSAR